MVKSVGSGSARRAMIIATAATVVGSLPVFFTAAMAVQVTDELAFGAVGIGAAVGTFFGTMAVASMPLGRVADRLGATVSLRIAALTAATAAFGIAIAARNFAGLVAGLIVAGLAASLAQPAANRLLMNRIRLERLGSAFGLKQSAPPMASMLAGLSVPAVALTVGWRWAYVLAGVLALGVALSVGPRPDNAPARVERKARSKPEPLPHRGTLVTLAIGFGLAFAASSVVLGFSVASAVRAGIPPQRAGLIFAAASLTAIATRLGAGVACDRTTVEPLRLSALLLTLGAVGIGLLATGRPTVLAMGTVLALAGTWGFPGVFWFALIRAYPATPGRITGTMAPAAMGGVIGPIGFGAVATGLSYPIAWGMAATLAVSASVAMLVGARRLMELGGL